MIFRSSVWYLKLVCWGVVQIKSLQQSISASEKAAKGLSDKEVAKESLAVLKQAKDVVNGLGPGGDLRKFCKPRNPLLVRLLLGDKVNMVAIRRDVSQVRQLRNLSKHAYIKHALKAEF